MKVSETHYTSVIQTFLPSGIRKKIKKLRGTPN